MATSDKKPARTPTFVVLEDHFAWMENGCCMSFAAKQIITDRSVIRILIDKKAPLMEGGL